jgi:hypothetical protein
MIVYKAGFYNMVIIPPLDSNIRVFANSINLLIIFTYIFFVSN